MSGVGIHIVINPLTSLCSYISVPLTCLARTASCEANMHNKEGITNMTVREEDVHDRDPVRQGHVSAFLFTPSAVSPESFASQLCLPTTLTLGRFASSLSLGLVVSLSLCLFVSLSLCLFSFSLICPPASQFPMFASLSLFDPV